MISLANQKRFIGLTIIGLATIVPLKMLGNRIALGQIAITVPTANQLQNFRDKALSEHNNYRVNHSAPNLTADDTLNTGSQGWAEHLASTGKFEHSSSTERNGAGENIYFGSTTDPAQAPDLLAKSAVAAWYGEQGNYDYNMPKFDAATGHFTQVVWVGTTTLGCGTASAKEAALSDGYQYYDYYVVCRYSPAGNVDGQFPDNVKRPAPGQKVGP